MAGISSTVTNYFSYRTGYLLIPFLGSLAVLPVGMGLMSTLDEMASVGRIVGYALVCGFGFGCVGFDSCLLSLATAKSVD
ncbi:hypothetical protein H0H92_014269 [Tricholoma furcatifolium]|nr:hypothetical protein H0H92_014269 [Tricholoma furcatifolium]